MNNEVKYNINLFKIEEYDKWYTNFLYFLIKYFFNSDNFSWVIKKQDFIKKWIEYWYTKRFLENVYQKWKNDNNFIYEITNKNNEKIIKIKSIFSKDKNTNLFVFIDRNLIKKIENINYFRNFCYIVMACSPYKSNNIIDEKQYVYKNPSRTINNIWSNFWKITKDVMWHRLERAKSIFNDFNITKRFGVYNLELTNINFIVRLSSLYSMKWIRYKKYSNKLENKEKSSNTKLSKYFLINSKYINKKIITFWDSNNNWFLPPENYEHLWYEIKKQVFNN